MGHLDVEDLVGRDLEQVAVENGDVGQLPLLERSPQVPFEGGRRVVDRVGRSASSTDIRCSGNHPSGGVPLNVLRVTAA